MAHFVRDTVREALDLSAIMDICMEERGQPPYHPAMLVAPLLYGYSRGIYSSRQLAETVEQCSSHFGVGAEHRRRATLERKHKGAGRPQHYATIKELEAVSRPDNQTQT